jgi:Zn finger protein HypA/HybF involved in hydrogenase expression
MMECWCKDCDEWQDTRKVEFIDIQENAYGEDSLTFVCPLCDTTQTSLVTGTTLLGFER